MDFAMFAEGVGGLLLAFVLFILVCAPIAFAVIAAVLTVCGRGSVVKSWLKNYGFSSKYSSSAQWNKCVINNSHNVHDSNSILIRHMDDDSAWLSDIHVNPSCSFFPSNSSYDTIGPGSWHKD
jgi:hypothetical protein